MVRIIFRIMDFGIPKGFMRIKILLYNFVLSELYENLREV